MSTTIRVVGTTAANPDSIHSDTPIVPGAIGTIQFSQEPIFFGFNWTGANQWKYNLIESAYFQMTQQNAPGMFNIAPLKESFVPAETTSENAPRAWWDHEYTGFYIASGTDITKKDSILEWNYGQYLLDAMRYGVAVTRYDTGIYKVYTPYAAEAKRPVIEVTFSDEKVYLTPVPAHSSYKNPRADVVLKWSNSQSHYNSTIEDPTQQSAVVTWRESGTSSTHTINVTTAQSVTIPADTWSAGTSYQWKVAVTATSGVTKESAWETVSTTASPAYPPRLRYPNGETVDGSKPVEFAWYDNSSESNNTGTDIVFSTDGTAWGDPLHFEYGNRSYTAPANTFTSGLNYWRGLAYNIDGTPGDWSAAAEFTVIASPRTPYMEVTSVSPRPVATWESDEQQAYQVQMGSYDSGLRYGLDHTFQCPEFLPDGQTTIRVRVMNQYNLWSEWANTSINIENKPGFSTPTLTVAQSQDALLSWTEVKSSTPISGLTWEIGKTISGTGGLSNSAGFCRSGYFDLDGAALVANGSPARDTDGNAYTALIAFYNGSTFLSRGTLYRYGTTPPEGATRARIVFGYTSSQGIAATQETADAFIGYLGSDDPAPVIVYRNGTQIAETDGLTYTDRWANGPTTYMVRAILGGDNYVDSNTVEINLETQHPMIAEPGGPWMELRYTTDAVHNTQTTVQQTVTLMQFSGSVYPEAEAAPYRQRSRQISVAFLNGQERAFEALLGRECVLKDQYGGVIYGIMSSMSKAQNQFYCVISATIQQLEGEP